MKEERKFEFDFHNEQVWCFYHSELCLMDESSLPFVKQHLKSVLMSGLG